MSSLKRIHSYQLLQTKDNGQPTASTPTATPTPKRRGRKPKSLMQQLAPTPRAPEPDPVEAEGDSSRAKRKRKPAFDENEFVIEMPGPKRRRKMESIVACSDSTLSDSNRIADDDGGGDFSMSEPESKDVSISLTSTSTPVPGLPASGVRARARARAGRRKKPVLIMPEIFPAHQPEEMAPEVKLIPGDDSKDDVGCDSKKEEEEHRRATNDDGQNFDPDSFLEDEFLNDAISGCGDEVTVTSFEATPTMATPVTPVTPTMATPVVKKRGPGRPRKSTVVSLPTPLPEPTASELSALGFATPTQLPRKRGRKKKCETQERLDSTETPPMGLDSTPGKRRRKRINYLELSGDVERDASVDLETVSAIETPSSSTPRPPSKRGRKPKPRVDDSTLSGSDFDATTLSIVKKKKTVEVVCGKCRSTFKTLQLFHLHAASAHGGVVSHESFLF